MLRPTPIQELGGYPASAGLAMAAVALYVAELSGFSTQALQLTVDAFWLEPWRLVTSALLHGGLIHLGFNVYWLWTLGSMCEKVLGSAKTLLLLFVWAAVSGAAEYALFSGGIGLSGVGYGLVGFTWVMSNRDPRFLGAMNRGTLVLFVVWFFVCIVTTWFGVLAVANAAHAAGALCGVLTGHALARRSPQEGFSFRRIAAAAAMVAFGVAAVIGASTWRPEINLSPRAGATSAYLGMVALEEGRAEDAVRYLEDAVRYEPRLLPSLARAYDLAGRPDDSARALERAAPRPLSTP